MKVPKYLAMAIFGVVLCRVTIAQEDATEARLLNESPTNSVREIHPLLEKHCFDCHGPEMQKAMLRLDNLDPTFAGAAAETWHDVLNRISIGEMPPEDRPIDTASRRKLVSWLRAGPRAGFSGMNSTSERLTTSTIGSSLARLSPINIPKT
ncbi:MAG: c-type cytochrome domain-containing protein, partial [Planctomycetota bacterium]